MTGVQWSGGARQRITHFTAAFFNDTGWYEVDFSRAAPASFGRNARCSFLSGVSAESCATRPIPDILSDWFVEAGAGYSCTPDLLSVGSPSELELYPG